MSERRACRVVGTDRKSMRYRSQQEDDADLRTKRELAQQRRQFGYRRLHILLQREGVVVNCSGSIVRIKLAVRRRRNRRRTSRSYLMVAICSSSWVNARYEKGSMILTSSRGFAEWGEIFGSPIVATALLDRLLHHAIVIQIDGSSYRLRRDADLLPEHVRSTARITPPAPTEARCCGRPPKDGRTSMPNP